MNPGFTIITSTWYKPSEHALRHGLWYGGASLAYIFGGILAYAISHIQSAIKGWQVCKPLSGDCQILIQFVANSSCQFLFIIFGAATLLIGLLVLWLLPDNPQTAWFLSERERRLAFSRVQGARHSAETRKWNHGQMKEAMLDPRSWLLFLLCLFTTLPGGGLTAVCSRLLSKCMFYISIRPMRSAYPKHC